MLALTLRNLAAHRRRLVGTSLAVCLGVAFLAGTFVLGDTMAANFDRLFASSIGDTDAVVRNADRVGGDVETAQALVAQEDIDRIASVDGVETSVAEIEGFGQLNGADGEKIGGNGPPTVAGNWIDDPDLNPYRLVEGRAPRGLDEVVVNVDAADVGGLAVGDTTTVETPQPVEVEIVGLVAWGDVDLGSYTYTGFSLEGAREHVLGGRPGATSVRVEATDGVSADQLRDRLAADLGGGVEVLTGSELVDEQNDEINSDFLGFLRTFLAAFGGIALLVAGFSINNTFSIIVAQRNRESALLRAVGASRRQVLGSMVLETALVGVVASALGVAAGIGIAVGLKAVFDAFGFALPAGGLTLTASSMVVAPLVGLGITLVAGIGPAIRGSRVPPLAALRDVAVDRTHASRIRLVAGVVMSGVGVAVVTASALTGTGGLGRAGLGALLVVAGVVTLGPAVAPGLAGALGAPVARTRGVPGGLARRNAVRNPRRTAATASALVVGVGVVSLFTVFAASLKASIDDSVSRAFGGDLVIASEGFGGGGLSPELAASVGGLPEVDRAVGLSPGVVRVGEDSDTWVTVADLEALDGVLDLGEVDGDLSAVAGDEVAVDAAYADEQGWSVGETIPVTFQDGEAVDLTLAATYDDPELVGQWMIPADLWQQHSIQVIDTVVLVALADGVSVADGEVAVQAVADGFGRPEVQDRQEYVDAASAGVDGMLTLIYVMLALAILIALMGIANALSLAIHERTRELGLLRAVGTTRPQMRSMVRWESVLVAGFGASVGIVVGAFLGWALVKAADGEDIISVFTIPVGSLAVILLVGALAGALAAVRPARRAARLDVLDAIATT